MQEIDGATGKLYLDESNRIRRRLAWAQFQKGEPVAMPDMDDLGGPIQDISDEAEQLLPELADDELWLEQTREL